MTKHVVSMRCLGMNTNSNFQIDVYVLIVKLDDCFTLHVIVPKMPPLVENPALFSHFGK